MLATAAAGAAQSHPAEPGSLDTAVKTGATVWVTDAGGHESKARIVGVTREVLTTSSGDGRREFRFTDVARIGALGAGVGIAVDALFRGPTTIYEASGGSMRLHAAPLVSRRGGGLRVTLAF